MNTPPEITDEEIRNAMDFDAVVKLVNLKESQSKKFNRQLRTALLLAGLVGLLWLGYVNIPAKKSEHQPPIEAIQPSHPTSKAPSRNPPPVPETNTAEVKKQEHPKKPTPSTPAVGIISKPSEKVTAGEPVSVTSTYTEAEPVNGFAALYEYFNRELKYPAEALKDSIQGVITVKFVINDRGLPEQIKVLHSLNPACDQEALRLIENMPPWKPALLNGAPVASKISVPLTFQIKIFKPR